MVDEARETHSARRDRFEAWLTAMDDHLAALRSSCPADVAVKLDLTPGSLDVLEAYLLERYESIHALRACSTGQTWNDAGAYVGEALRLAVGGKWSLQLGDPKMVFYGLPVLTEFPSASPVCPMALVSAAVDRRTGKFLRQRLDTAAARG